MSQGTVKKSAIGAHEVIGRAPENIPVWSEEFDAGPGPDEQTWTHDLGDGGWGNSELQTYTCDPANIRIEDSQLIITALREENRFTSARIKTEGSFEFTYGTVEARVQIPDLANGLWPAVWALGGSFSEIGWPASGEIIVMEMGVEGAVEEGLANRRIISAAHWQKGGIHETAAAKLDHPHQLDGKFHTFRMDWTLTEIRTYIDDLQIWTLDILNIPQFHKPHFLLLNMAVGGRHTGIIDPGGITARFPAEYRVDYIRVFDNGFTRIEEPSNSSMKDE